MLAVPLIFVGGRSLSTKPLRSPGLSGAGREEAGEDKQGKRHIALTHFSDIFQRRPVPLKCAPCLIASTCPRAKGPFGRLRGEEGGTAGRSTLNICISVKKRESRGKQK